VAQVTGNAGVLLDLATSGVTASGTTYSIPWAVIPFTTSDGNPHTMDTLAVADLTTTDFLYRLIAHDTGNGDSWSGTFLATYTRNGGAPVAVNAWAAPTNVAFTGGASAWVAAVAISGNNAVTTVTGATGRTIHWSLKREQQQVA
jgi:hypothetical protein